MLTVLYQTLIKKIEIELKSINIFKKKCNKSGNYRNKWCYFGIKPIENKDNIGIKPIENKDNIDIM